MTTIGRKPTRIFIIGPMHESRDARNLPYDVHNGNIKRAAEIVIGEIEKKFPGRLPFCDVIPPPNEPGGIVRSVFSHLFHCDLAIADISSGSPNVYYELAILHSLGVPVIVLTVAGQYAFYMAQTNVVDLKSFEVDAIAAGLRGRDGPGHLELILTQLKDAHRSNPITNYLNNVPLVHYSAVNGIAMGYYLNFVQWIIKDGGVFRLNPNFKSLIMVEPSRVKSVDEDIGRLEEAFGSIRLDEKGQLRKQLDVHVHEDRAHARGIFTLKKIGQHLIDYPTPISSLKVSRQYQDATRYYQEYSAPMDDDTLDIEARGYEKSLIDAFVSIVRSLVQNAPNFDDRKFQVMTVDEIIKRFASERT